MAKNIKVVGAFEKVDFPAFGINGVLAKIDTGAYSGAIHCSSLQEVEAGGKKVLQFTPSDTGEQVETTDYNMIHVRSASGHYGERYLINTEVIIQGATYPIRIGLSDRSSLKYEVLIGRRFLRENGILVDVRLNEELDIDRTYNL